MFKLYFDYSELISLNFYKIVFKPIKIDNYFSDIFLSAIRHLLFNTKGCAATEISIKGLNNEYGYFFGLKEDILNLILNVKGLVFKLRKNINKLIINLSSKTKIVRGSDIKKNKFFKVINPDHIICNLNENINFNLKIKIENGRGYVPFSDNKYFQKNKIFKNGILLNTNFCPILRASYLVKDIHNNFNSNLKRVIFFLETNGSISVTKALAGAISSFINNFSNFKPSRTNKKNIFFNNFEISIFEYNFSIKTIKILINFNIYFLDDLLKCSKNDLFKIDNFNEKIFFEIKNSLFLYYNFYFKF